MQHTEHIVNVSGMERREKWLWDGVAPNKILKTGFQAHQMSPKQLLGPCGVSCLEQEVSGQQEGQESYWEG